MRTMAIPLSEACFLLTDFGKNDVIYLLFEITVLLMKYCEAIKVVIFEVDV